MEAKEGQGSIGKVNSKLSDQVKILFSEWIDSIGNMVMIIQT